MVELENDEYQGGSSDPSSGCLLAVIHHHDVHSSEQPGKESSKDLDLSSSSFRVLSYFTKLLYL